MKLKQMACVQSSNTSCDGHRVVSYLKIEVSPSQMLAFMIDTKENIAEHLALVKKNFNNAEEVLFMMDINPIIYSL